MNQSSYVALPLSASAAALDALPRGPAGGLLSVPAAQATAVLPLSSLDGSNGFRLDGVAADSSGFAVSAARDINGDGVDDLIIGAPFANPNGTDSGSSYVVFGNNVAIFRDGSEGGGCP